MERRELDLRTYDDLIADVKHLHEAGYDRIGKWDLASTCEHLHKSMHHGLHGFDFKAPFFFKLMRPFIKKQLFGTRKIKEGYKAPAGFVFEPGGDEAKAVEELCAISEQYKTATQFATHPLFGDMPPSMWQDFHCIHASHHLSFLLPKSADQARSEEEAEAVA